MNKTTQNPLPVVHSTSNKKMMYFKYDNVILQNYYLILLFNHQIRYKSKHNNSNIHDTILNAKYIFALTINLKVKYIT